MSIFISIFLHVTLLKSIHIFGIPVSFSLKCCYSSLFPHRQELMSVKSNAAVSGVGGGQVGNPFKGLLHQLVKGLGVKFLVEECRSLILLMFLVVLLEWITAGFWDW